MPKVYDVIEQTDYIIVLNPTENIEECGDVFLTEEEVKEMGLDYVYSWSNSTYLIRTAAKQKLMEYYSSIPKNKKSCIIRDENLIDALKKTDTPVSTLIDGTRRVGNRLFKHTSAEKKEQTEVKYRDFTSLCVLIERCLSNKGIHIDIKTTQIRQRRDTIKLFKKVTTWKELEDFNSSEDNHYHYSESNLTWMKRAFEHPNEIPEVQKDD